MPDSAKIVPTAFSQMAGVGEEKPRSGEQSVTDILRTTLSSYSPAEFRSIVENQYVSRRDVSNPNLTNAEGLISYFLPIHEQIGQVIFDTEKMKKLAPEINQAKLIRVSSVMSPNDLQEGSFSFDIDQIPGLTEDARGKITTLLAEFFNDTEKLGKKANKWIGDCLYGSGSVPILILPSSFQKAMRKDGLHVIGNSSFNITDPKNRFKTKLELMDAMCNETVYSMDTGLESWKTPFVKDPKKPTEISDRFNLFINDAIAEIPTHTFEAKEIKQLKASVEQITVNFVKTIEEGDVIKLTENPEIIKFATEYRKKNKKVIENQIDRHLRARMVYDPDELVSLNKYEDTDEVDEGHPLLLELPAEAVIPICVPGNEKEHLGYFILLDEMGQPMKANEQDVARTYGWAGSPQAAYNAMYGSNDKNAFTSSNFKSYEEQTVRRVFDGLMDQFLKSRLKGIGLDDVSITKSNAIVTTMLYRMLENKRTRILFVPTSLLTYLCFDYRPNGTGKSLLEDVHYLLSLRITFQVAAIMGMAKDAINHRTLNLSFDEKETNPLALMEQLVNIFVEKERMPFSMNPDEISRGIARNAISVAPKNLPGLSAFEIEKVNDGGGGGNKPDTELLDTLTNMLVTALGVPYSALNQLGEQEYARSITTTNLFFSKQVRNDQDIVCQHLGDMVKTYIKYSPKLQKKLLQIIQSFMKKPDEKKLNADEDRGTEPSTQHAPELRKDILDDANKILKLIIDKIHLNLPTPNIAQDKAQYTEIKDYMETVTQFLDIMFAQELVPSDNMEATNALNIIKANLRKVIIEDYFHKVGSMNTFEVTSIEEFVAKNDVSSSVQALMNFAKELKDTMTKLSSGTQDAFGGGMDQSMGMDDGMGMGDDMGMGMDMGGGMGGEEPSPMDMDSQTPQPEETNLLPEEVPATQKEENNGGNFTTDNNNKI